MHALIIRQGVIFHAANDTRQKRIGGALKKETIAAHVARSLFFVATSPIFHGTSSGSRKVLGTMSGDVHIEYAMIGWVFGRRALLKECSACCFQEERDSMEMQFGAEHHNAAD
jgi:hypothetical protein